MSDKFAEELSKAFKGGLRRGRDPIWHYTFVPSGIPSLDWVLGGGVALSRMTELLGVWQSGKSAMLAVFLGQNQKLGGVSVLLASEGDYDPELYTQYGVDVDAPTFRVEPVRTVEQVFTTIQKIYRVLKKAKDSGDQQRVVVGWDGIAATGTKHLQSRGMFKRDMSRPGLMSQGCALVSDLVREVNLGLIATNQLRSGPDIDDDSNTAAGKAWKFHCSQRLELRYDGGFEASKIVAENTGRADLDGILLGHWLRIEAIKNRIVPPHRIGRIPFFQEEGFPHPEFPGLKTEFGFDSRWAAFEHYLQDPVVFGEDKERAITGGGGGYYALNEKITQQAVEAGETVKKFRRKEWPEVVVRFPQLMQPCFDFTRLCKKCKTFTPQKNEEVCDVCKMRKRKRA